MQENHFSLLQRETEKLRGDIDKMRSELKLVLAYDFTKLFTPRICISILKLMAHFVRNRYEIDKVTAGQRLDLNLERG